jgi:WD40 repeat protein
VIDPKELAARPTPADAFKREQIPPDLMRLAGGGDPERVPPEVVAILGDARYRLPETGMNSWMAQDPAGQFLAVPNSNRVAIFDAPTGLLVRTLTAHPVKANGFNGRAYAVAFGPDGKHLAASVWEGAWNDKVRNCHIKVWDLATGNETATLSSGAGWVWSLAFSPDGKHLLSGCDKGAEVWDLATGKAAHSLPGGHVWRLGVSPDGKKDGLLMASSGSDDGTVRLWNTDDKQEREQVIRLYPPRTTWLHGLLMSPEGRHLATANPDGTITILRLAKPGEVFEVKTSE